MLDDSLKRLCLLRERGAFYGGNDPHQTDDDCVTLVILERLRVEARDVRGQANRTKIITKKMQKLTQKWRTSSLLAKRTKADGSSAAMRVTGRSKETVADLPGSHISVTRRGGYWRTMMRARFVAMTPS